METQTLQRTLSSLLRGCRVRQRGPSTFEMQRCAIMPGPRPSGHKAECHASDLAKCCSDSHRHLPQTKPGRRFPEVQGRSLSLARELPESPRPRPAQSRAQPRLSRYFERLSVSVSSGLIRSSGSAPPLLGTPRGETLSGAARPGPAWSLQTSKLRSHLHCHHLPPLPSACSRPPAQAQGPARSRPQTH